MGKAEAARVIEPLCMLWCIPGFIRNEWTHAFKLLHKECGDRARRNLRRGGVTGLLLRIGGSSSHRIGGLLPSSLLGVPTDRPR